MVGANLWSLLPVSRSLSTLSLRVYAPYLVVKDSDRIIATKNSLYFYKLFFVYLTLLSYFFLSIYFIYSPAGFQESLSSLFSISFRSTVYATFTSLSFLMINSESPYSDPLSAQSYVYPNLVHGYFPSK